MARLQWRVTVMRDTVKRTDPAHVPGGSVLNAG